MNWTRIRNQLGKRSAIVGAGVAGFLVGAGGFVAAQIDDAPSAEQEIETENTIDDSPSTTDETVPDTTVADSMPDDSISPTSVDLTVPDITVAGSSSNSVPSNTVDDSTSSSVPANTIDDHGGERGDDDSDDSTSSSVPSNTIDDSTSSSVPTNTIDDHGDDDSTSSSVPSNTIDDSTSSSVPASLPAAFSQSYQSAGGSIAVTWTGTAFVLDSVSPAPGFAAEIEDQSWDRVRVDFEGAGDARIEVRLNDGQIRVRID